MGWEAAARPFEFRVWVRAGGSVDVGGHYVSPLVGRCAVGAEEAGDEAGSGVREGNAKLAPGVLALADSSAEPPQSARSQATGRALSGRPTRRQVGSLGGGFRSEEHAVSEVDGSRAVAAPLPPEAPAVRKTGSFTTSNNHRERKRSRPPRAHDARPSRRGSSLWPAAVAGHSGTRSWKPSTAPVDRPARARCPSRVAAAERRAGVYRSRTSRGLAATLSARGGQPGHLASMGGDIATLSARH